MNTAEITSIHRLVWCALMAALVALGAFLQIPVGLVPFTLQPYFVLLAGFLLGSLRGALAVALYLAAGFLGLPVFAGGKAGLAVLLGPTGGFLVGFVLAAAVAGLAERSVFPSWGRGLLLGAAAVACVYVPGVVHLAGVLGVEPGRAMAVGVVPFLLQDIVKIVLAVATWRWMRARRLAPR